MNSGGIRGSLEIGEITRADILTVMPFENTIDLLGIKGKYLKETFEQTAARVSPDGEIRGSGAFLQVSGNIMLLAVRSRADFWLFLLTLTTRWQ